MRHQYPWPLRHYRPRTVDAAATRAFRASTVTTDAQAYKAMKEANREARAADPFAADVMDLWEKTSKADLFVMCLNLAALATGAYDSAIKDNNAEGALRRMLEERFCALNKPSRTFPRQPARED